METIVKIGEFGPELQQEIDREFKCLSPEDVLGSEPLRNTVEGLLTRSVCRIDAGLIDKLPALRVISTSGVGFDGIPVEAAAARGIIVTNTPGVLDAAVCELGIGLLLGMLRQIPAADRHVRHGAWQRGAFPLTTSLEGLRIGIVGLGRIGQGMARRLEPFGVAISYTHPRKLDVPWSYVANLSELAADSDVLLVCCKGGDATHHLIDAAVFAALDDGWLVNISRGSVVDEAALCQALERGRLRGAALDVYAVEPLRDSPLRSLPNVLLSPHTASGTHQTRQLMLRLALDNLHAVLERRPPLTPVTRRS